MYFHPKLAWPPATYDVISRNHSNWPSLIKTCLKMCVRNEWTGTEKLRKTFWGGGMASTAPPPLYVQGLIEPKSRLHQWIHTENTQKYIRNQSSLLTLLIKRQNMTIFLVCRTRYSTSHTTRGTLGGTQYRNTVRKNGKYRNTASKIV